MAKSIAIGPFTCDVALRRVRPIEMVREEREGVTYLSASDYELAYETTLIFDDGGRLPIKAKVFGEGARLMVIRNELGEPARFRGWVRGSIQLLDEHDHTIFRGAYYDVNVVMNLSGDEALTPTDQRLEHWESGFGEGQYLGHAFSMRAEMTRSGAPVGGEAGPLAGKGVGFID